MKVIGRGISANNAVIEMSSFSKSGVFCCTSIFDMSKSHSLYGVGFSAKTGKIEATMIVSEIEIITDSWVLHEIFSYPASLQFPISRLWTFLHRNSIDFLQTFLDHLHIVYCLLTFHIHIHLA